MKAAERSTYIHKLKNCIITFGAVIIICCLIVALACHSSSSAENAAPENALTQGTFPRDNINSFTGNDPDDSDTDDQSVSLEELFRRELSLVPFKHIQFLKLRGWRIEMTSKDIAAEYGYSSQLTGITDYNKNIIYISAKDYAIRRATIHEIGHALAYELGWAEETYEFYVCYELEKDRFTDCCSVGDGHEISDKYEYFASVYQNIVLDYDETCSEVPRTVSYIEKRLSEIFIFDFPKLYLAFNDR